VKWYSPPTPVRRLRLREKRHKIEHRLFSHISMNWRGRPLTSHEGVVNTIAATTTRTGLTVKAMLDEGSYPTGLRITDAQMRQLLDRHIKPHEFHGDWNYDVVRHEAPSNRTGMKGPRSRAVAAARES